MGNWGITPGIRYEHLNQEYQNNLEPKPGDVAQGSSAMDLYAGGASLDYRFNDDLMMLASAHRGFSPPGPADAVLT